MQTLRPFFTQHYFRRVLLWTVAVLVWMEGAVFGDREVSWRHVLQRCNLIWLPGLSRMVGALVFARALQFARLRPRKQIIYWRHGRDQRRPHFRRSVLGSELRRAMTHKDERVWIARLIAVLRNLDVHARTLARRLRRGHRRLWRTTPPVGPAAPVLGAAAPACLSLGGGGSPALADSS